MLLCGRAALDLNHLLCSSIQAGQILSPVQLDAMMYEEWYVLFFLGSSLSYTNTTTRSGNASLGIQ